MGQPWTVFFVVTVAVPSSEELTLAIIGELWQIGRGYNVVVVFQQDNLLNLYTWFPYSSHDNCGDVKNVVLINQWVMEGEGKFVREGSLYPSKIPSNFHGCTVNLSVLMRGGPEDEMYSQYFLTHNITRNYINEFTNVAPVFEDIITSMQSLWDGESDMVFGGLPLVVKEISKAEPTFPYFAVELNWFVPCPKPFSRLQKISHIFSPSVWVAIVGVLFLVTVTSWCLAKQSKDIRSYTTLSSVLYNVWAVTVGVPVTGMPRSLRFRLLFLVFVFYCFAIGTVFQTYMTSFLVDPGYENQLNSVDEILDSGIAFGYTEEVNIFFTYSSDLRHKEVAERAEICSTYKLCIDRIRETGSFASFDFIWVVQNYTNVINDHSTVCLLNNDDYAFIFLTTYVQKRTFFLELLNKYIIHFFEFGMFVRLTRGSLYVPKPIRDNFNMSDGYFAFALSHLHIAFYFLFVGHILSFLLFLCEVFYHFRLRCV